MAVADTVELIDFIDGLRAVVAGPLRFARYSEQLTMLLLSINRRYKIHAGIRVTHL